MNTLNWKQSFYTYFAVFLLTFICFTTANAQTLLPKLQDLFGVENVKYIEKSAFKEYYEINVSQPIDHDDEAKGRFLQRVLLGFNDSDMPTVMETEGYKLNGMQLNPDYKTELTDLLKANQIVVEHRYFGNSIPDAKDKSFLTYKQASGDYHRIRQAFDGIFPKKWATTGFSKSGDAAFAYKFFYPDDVEATLVYGISLTLEKEDKRFDKFFAEKRKTPAGKKILADQIYLLKNKKRLMPLFVQMAKFNNLDPTGLDVETIYDYAVLEFEVFFWQFYGNYEEFEKDFNEGYEITLAEGFKPSVPVTNFRDKISAIIFGGVADFMRETNRGLYYQAFTQGGYYGYDERPLRKYLKNKDYPLDVLTGEKVVFDNTFRMAQKKYAETSMERMIFVNASTDPWSVCTIPVPPNKDNLKIVKDNSNHLLHVKDFDEATQNKVLEKLNKWLNLK